jgi:hypothetical protein
MKGLGDLQKGRTMTFTAHLLWWSPGEEVEPTAGGVILAARIFGRNLKA